MNIYNKILILLFVLVGAGLLWMIASGEKVGGSPLAAPTQDDEGLLSVLIDFLDAAFSFGLNIARLAIELQNAIWEVLPDGLRCLMGFAYLAIGFLAVVGVYTLGIGRGFIRRVW